MESFNYIKKYFSTKNLIPNQITLFSMLGILFLLFCKISTNFGFSYLLSDFYIAQSNTVFEKCLVLIVFLVGCVYLTGYTLKSINSFNNSEDDFLNFDLKPFVNFIKIIPIFLTWSIYLTSLILFLIIILKLKILLVLFTCLIPFLEMIFIDFANKLNFKKKYFNPIFIFSLIHKHIASVLIVSVIFIGISVVTYFVLNKIYILIMGLNSTSIKFSLQLLLGAISTYILYSLKLSYLFGLNFILRQNSKY